MLIVRYMHTRNRRMNECTRYVHVYVAVHVTNNFQGSLNTKETLVQCYSTVNAPSLNLNYLYPQTIHLEPYRIHNYMYTYKNDLWVSSLGTQQPLCQCQFVASVKLLSCHHQLQRAQLTHKHSSLHLLPGWTVQCSR